MKICYALSSSARHLRAGAGFVRCLQRAGAELCESLDEADVVVLHDDPPLYPAYYQTLPVLESKHVIGYAAWELDVLPPSYHEGLWLVDEIWTCSGFTQQAMAADFPRVFKVPPLVTAGSCRPHKEQAIKDLIGYDEKLFYYYSALDVTDPRSNFWALAAAFQRLLPLLKKRAVLLVRQAGRPVELVAELPQVISVEAELDDEHLTALQRLADCYVSTHCSQAFGLALAEAMAHGRPVVATGYSGNLDYMTEESSYPVRCRIRHLLEHEVAGNPRLLSAEMSWALIDEDDLCDKLLECFINQGAEPKAAAARRAVAAYGEDRLTATLIERLAATRQHLSQR